VQNEIQRPTILGMTFDPGGESGKFVSVLSELLVGTSVEKHRPGNKADHISAQRIAVTKLGHCEHSAFSAASCTFNWRKLERPRLVAQVAAGRCGLGYAAHEVVTLDS
jgi:hypothetical protein